MTNLGKEREGRGGDRKNKPRLTPTLCAATSVAAKCTGAAYLQI